MIGPDGRLVRLAAAWTAGAALLVAWPTLWPLAAAALGALAVVAGWDVVRLYGLPAVTVVRSVPQRALVDRECELVLEIANAGARATEVDLIDELPGTVAPEEPELAGLRVAPGAAVTVRRTVRPVERGDLRLGPVIVLQRSPWGLWRRRTIAATGTSLAVYPDASRYLGTRALEPRRILAVLGVRPARARGTGMEFDSLRDYVIGDDVRRIDWAATARRGRPVSRIYRHERNRTVLVALDTSRLMASLIDGRTKLDHAVDAALALAYAAIVVGDQVGMVTFDGEVRAELAPGPRRHLGAFVELLRSVRPRMVEASYVALARHLAAGRRQRALVIVLTDFIDADAAALVEPLALVARRHRVLFTAVRDRIYGALTPAGPDAPLDLYRRLVLDELLYDREQALARLRRAGLETLDLVPEQITSELLNRYLAMRQAVVA